MKFLLRLNALGGYVAGALLWVLAFIVFLDVLLRAFSSPFLWVNEVSVYLLVAIVFLGAGYTYDRDGHFAITFIADRLPRVPRLVLELAIVLLSLAFALLLTWGGIELVRFARSLSMASPTLLHTPLWIPYSAVIAGGASLSISLWARAVTLVHALRHGGDVASRTEHSV